MSILDVFSKAVDADPAGAATLMDEVAINLGMAMIEDSREELTKAVLEDADLRIRAAKARLGRDYVAKAASGAYPDGEHLQAARWLAGMQDYISKASKLEEWYVAGHMERRRVVRDALGRFAAVHGQSAPVIGMNASADDDPRVAPVRQRSRIDEQGVIRANRADDERMLNEFQSQAVAARDKAAAWRQKLGAADTANAIVEFTVRGSGRVVQARLEDIANGDFPDGMDTRRPITGMRLLADRSADPESAKRIESGNLNLFGRLTQDKERNAALFAERGASSRTKATMQRLGIIGDLVNEVSPGNKLGRMAALVGTYGPEAAEVLGPHARRAAYRYRGTERTPDPELMSDLDGEAKAELERIAEVIDSPQGESAAFVAAKISDKGADLADPMLQSVKYRGETDANASGDSIRLGVRSDLATAHLLKTLPTKSLIGELSRKSGHVLPSQGVLIDADGDVISQSAGFGEDHYLPFNLGTMGRARGGQYVRTRQQGGLTGEDIYASVLHGVRSATVASSSGVFRLEFAPDFRGARANSDKAFAMYDRYLKLLGELQNEGVYALDLDESEKAKIAATILNKPANAKLARGSREIKAQIEEAVEVARRKKLGAVDIAATRDLAEKQISAEYPGLSTQQRAIAINERFKELYQAEQDKQVQVLNLNGEGYTMALQALQAQFPYFIRAVEYEPLRGEKDVDASNRKGSPAVFSYGRRDMGFLARRGLPLSTGPKPSRASDKGFVGAGALTRAETSRVIGEETPQAPAPPSGGAQAPAAPATGTGSQPAPTAAAATPAAPVDTASAASRLAVQSGRLNDSARDELVRVFVNKLVPITHRVRGGEQAQPWKARGEFTAEVKEATSLDQLADKSDKVKMAWLLSRETENSMRAAFDASGAELVKLFASAKPTTVEAALELVWPEDSLKEIVDVNSPFDANSINELVARIKDNAVNIAEFDMLSKPFSEESEDRDVTRAVAFSDIVDLPGADAVRQFAADNPDLAGVAERLGTAGGKLLRPADLTLRMMAAQDAVDDLVNGAATMDSADPENQPKVFADFVRTHGKKIQDGLIAPLGYTQEQASTLIQAVLAGVKSEDDLYDQEFRTLQRARTLLEVQRVHGVVEGGGVSPKAGLLWKAAPRLVRQLQDPISKAAAARRTAKYRR